MSLNKKTIIYTYKALPAALASQASKSSDLQTGELIWFPKSKQKQKYCSFIKKMRRARQIGC